jgi:hypothetical protein
MLRIPICVKLFIVIVILLVFSKYKIGRLYVKKYLGLIFCILII